jgi:undecaprenyl diphosphate synthase
MIAGLDLATSPDASFSAVAPAPVQHPTCRHQLGWPSCSSGPAAICNGSVAEVAMLVDAFQALGSTFSLMLACVNVCAVAYLVLRQPASRVLSSTWVNRLQWLASAAWESGILLLPAQWNRLGAVVWTTCQEGCENTAAARGVTEEWSAGRSHHGVHHLAVIMDGNRRYGKQRQAVEVAQTEVEKSEEGPFETCELIRSSPLSGHYAGGEKLMEFIQWCIHSRIQVLTVYAFSTENWGRPQKEIDVLMYLFEHFFEKIRAMARQHGIFIRFVSTDPYLLSGRIQTLMVAIEEETRKLPNRKIVVNVCVSYGGRSEIINACRAVLSAEQPSARPAGVQSVSESAVSLRMLRSITQAEHEEEDREVLKGGLCEPQALLRTSGEQRISNFLLWQCAYSELFFVKKTWPELTRDDLTSMLVEFEVRQRRFGK